MVDLQTRATWESAIADWPRTRGHRLLRAYADELNARLAETWLVKGPRPRRLLKTDLFDEAVGSGLYPCLRELADEVHGIDVSDAVVAAARPLSRARGRASRRPPAAVPRRILRRRRLVLDARPLRHAGRAGGRARRAGPRARSGWSDARHARQRVEPPRLDPQRAPVALARERPARPLLRRSDVQRGRAGEPAGERRARRREDRDPDARPARGRPRPGRRLVRAALAPSARCSPPSGSANFRTRNVTAQFVAALAVKHA